MSIVTINPTVREIPTTQLSQIPLGTYFYGIIKDSTLSVEGMKLWLLVQPESPQHSSYILDVQSSVLYTILKKVDTKFIDYQPVNISISPETVSIEFNLDEPEGYRLFLKTKSILIDIQSSQEWLLNDISVTEISLSFFKPVHVQITVHPMNTKDECTLRQLNVKDINDADTRKAWAHELDKPEMRDMVSLETKAKLIADIDSKP